MTASGKISFGRVGFTLLLVEKELHMDMLKVLIVEDEAIPAKTLELRLRNLGHTVVAIEPFGENAIETATRYAPNLVMMDIHLRGEMDGIQAANQIRGQLDIPVIFTTSQDDDETLQRAKVTDAFGYLIKPYELHDLRTSIEMAFYKHATDRKLRESEERYRLISELMSDFAYSQRINPDGTVTPEWTTDAFNKIVGYTIQDVLAFGSFDPIVHPDDVNLFHERMRDLMAGKTRVDEYRIVDKQGGVKWLRDYARPVWDATQQHVVRVVGAAQDITERKRAEQALANERNLLRTVIDNLPDLVFVKDPQARYVMNNAKHLRELGNKTQAEVVGKTAFDFYPEPLGSTFHQNDLNVLATHQPWMTEEDESLDLSDRSVRWHQTSKLPLYDQQGNLLGLVGILHDITERKRIEQALANERNLLRTVVDNLPDAIYVKDLESRYVLNNPAHLKTLGVNTQADTLGKSSFHFFPDHFAARYFAAEQEMMRTGEPILNLEELVVYASTGETHWHLTTKVPLHDANGKTVGMVGISRDITESKRTQEDILRQKIHFEQLFENAPIAIAMLDADSRIERINPEFERLFQYSAEEIAGHTIAQAIVPANRLPEAERTSREVLGGASVHTESTRQSKDGTIVPVELYGVPVVLKGKTIGLYAMYVDIAERKQAEDRLHYASTHDALTGLFNRAYFEQELERLTHNPRYPISLVMADVDRLKLTNDTLGHAAGDELLRRAASVLQSAFRTDDIIARIGGDEFAVILAHTDAAAIKETVNRVQRAIYEHNAKYVDVPVSFSIGAATAHYGTSLAQAMIDADAAMYQNKQSRHL
jgi:diguanylate cyclase (GGDEF)-like protein/PAS domain S-box-containing protein